MDKSKRIKISERGIRYFELSSHKLSAKPPTSDIINLERPPALAAAARLGPPELGSQAIFYLAATLLCVQLMMSASGAAKFNRMGEFCIFQSERAPQR